MIVTLLNWGLTNQRIAQEIKDRSLLLPTGFNDGEDAFDKAAAQVRLSTMRVTPPDNGVTQGAFGAVVGRFKAGYGYKTP